MTVDPTISSPQSKPISLADTCRRLLRSAGPEACRLRLSMIALTAAAAFQGLSFACLLPLLSGVLSPGEQPWWWYVAMIAFAVASIVLRWWAQGFDYGGHLSLATNALRMQIGKQLRKMPLEQLQDRRAGEINAAVLGSVDENLAYALTVLNLILTATVTPAVAAIGVLFVDWRLGLMLLAVFPAIIPLYRIMRPIARRSRRELAAAHERLNADIVEYAQGLQALRSARCEGARAGALRERFAALEHLQATEHRRGSRPTVFFVSVVELGMMAIASIGVAFVANGTLDLAVLAAVLIMLARFAEPLATFVTYSAILDVIGAALERIEALLSIEPLPALRPVQEPDGNDIRFDNVTFQYERSGEPTIASFNAVIPACSLTALVGPSGSGKTTVTRLLQRHADPQQGAITIGGADLRAMPADSLNALVSVVFQDVYLFDDTVMANIRFARPNASDEEVIDAARSAQCLDFIEILPDGWQTPVGGLGSRLSGGEKQRISIARALLKNTPIVILDEPTAALDSETDLAVQQAIRALVRDRTVIVIAHRLPTIVHADQIIVLEDGVIVEKGGHRELLEKSGKYASLWRASQSYGATDVHPA